jgi:SMC interacting uncharacterized protein involved in chromosome segregation
MKACPKCGSEDADQPKAIAAGLQRVNSALEAELSRLREENERLKERVTAVVECAKGDRDYILNLERLSETGEPLHEYIDTLRSQLTAKDAEIANFKSQNQHREIAEWRAWGDTVEHAFGCASMFTYPNRKPCDCHVSTKPKPQ